MVVSFPAGIVRALMDNMSPNTLGFLIKNITNVEQFIANKQLIVEDESLSSPSGRTFCFNMSSLSEHLRRQAEQNKNAAYFNIDILKYQVKSRPGFGSVPLQLATFWQYSTETQADFRLDYSYSTAALSSPCPLSNVGVILSVDAPIALMQSQPPGTWSAEAKRASWKLGDIPVLSEAGGQGSLRATFDLLPSAAGQQSSVNSIMTAVQFSGEGTTLSGVDFELAGTGYRVSLIKKRFITGKYISALE
jgi:hypothetical protein